MLLAIFRDIFSKNRLYLFLFSLSILLYYKYVRVEFSTNFRILMLSTFIVTALSTFQLLYSYFLTDRMEGYFQLPISINYFKITFISIIFTCISTKITYAINELLYFEIKDKASSHSHWCAFHHLTQTIQENRQTSLILSNCLQIILPYCQKNCYAS